MDIDTEKLRRGIDAFCQAHDMNKGRLGAEVLGNPSFFYRFDKGKVNPRLDTLFKIRQFLEERDFY